MINWETLSWWSLLGETWLIALAHFLWQGVVIAGVAWLSRIVLARRSASTRYNVLLVLFGLLVSTPIFTFALIGSRNATSELASAEERFRSTESGNVPSGSLVRVEEANVGPLPVEFDNDLTRDIGETPALPMPAGSNQVSALSSQDGVTQAWIINGLLVVYLVGVSIRLVQVALALGGGWRLVQNANEPVDERLKGILHSLANSFGMRRLPQIRGSAGINVPTVIGVFRPIILLPVSIMSSLSASEVESILIHELAHIRRLDFVINLFQRMVEALFFFHPAVWYLSSALRQEREFCCDDWVLKNGLNSVEYSSTLLRVAELGQANEVRPGNFVAVNIVDEPSLLRRRINRMLFVRQQRARFRINPFWLIGILAIAMISVSLLIQPSSARKVFAQEHDLDWGKAQNGLRIRIISVTHDIDEQNPELNRKLEKSQFKQPNEVALIAEIQNVSDEPIRFQGIRYGATVSAPHKFRVASNKFAPLVFDLNLYNEKGEPIKVPLASSDVRQRMLESTGGKAELLEPSKTMLMVLYPMEWVPGLQAALDQGESRLSITYRGASKELQQEIAKHWPNHDLVGVWNGEIVSNEIKFKIEEPLPQPKELHWGEPVNGLSLAVEYRLSDRRAESIDDYREQVFPIRSKVDVIYHVKNVTDEKVTFESEEFRQSDAIAVTDKKGETQQVSKAWYSGWPIVKTWEIDPGQEFVFTADYIGFKAADDPHEFPHVISGIVNAQPGRYELVHSVDGMKSGKTKVTIRERVESDEPRVFAVSIRFVTAAGERIPSGYASVSSNDSREPLFEGEFDGGVLVVPNCTGTELRVYVRAPGFEEQSFFAVKAIEGQVKSFELTPALPLRFRLVDRLGKPVKGAVVRYFNRSKMLASAGPYPIQGLEGAIWSRSDEDGEVVLDSLQDLAPNDSELGRNIYWFYIEPNGLAPLFIGPVTAGEELGDIEVGPFLTVQGEIRGTKEELDQFSADWDQPETMFRGDGTEGWDYANSVKLETETDGDVLRFTLTGLRPGKLRIIGNFKGDGGRHMVYTRRKPGPTDEVFEWELNESRDDLIVEPKRD